MSNKYLFKQIKTVSIYMLPLFLLTTVTFGQTAANTPEEKAQMREEKQNLIQENKADKQQAKDALMEKREEKVRNRCENVAEKIDLKVSRYNTNRQLYVDRYDVLRERISNWIARLDSEGYDVSTLESKLDVLKTKIEKIATLHEGFISDLEDLKQFECGNSDGAYKNQLMAGQNQLAEIRAAVMDIRKYFIEEVKPEILALRNLVAEDKETETE